MLLIRRSVVESSVLKVNCFAYMYTYDEPGMSDAKREEALVRAVKEFNHKHGTHFNPYVMYEEYLCS